MQSAKNLEITGVVRKLIVFTYQVTAGFPKSEMYNLTSQMRRAAVSIGSNIAEGCGRSTDGAYRKALDEAMGEASELEFQCWVAGDLKFGNQADLKRLTAGVVRVKKMLSRLIVSVRNRPSKSWESWTPHTRPEPRSPETPEPP